MTTLNLIEMFASVQGETSLTGLPTTFIRLAACNLRCTWCDTTYSFERGSPHSFDAIMDTVKNNACPYVCVTGGEPLLQKNVYDLLTLLCDQGYIVSLETGGSLPTVKVDPRVLTILDVKCPGSGMSAKNCLENLLCLKEHDEVKFVILDRADFDFSMQICQQYGLFHRRKEVLFSPVFGALEAKTLVAWILEHKIPARLNCQVHKFIWEPTTKGV